MTTTAMKTRILKVPLAGTDEAALGRWATLPDGTRDLSRWEIPASSPESDPVLAPLREAAHLLQTTSAPVAFPTETVYGLGADATRSDAVRGIYAAKGRPADNPLIVHVADLAMLRRLLRPNPSSSSSSSSSNTTDEEADPIPAIYRPLIARFWPGPLTILLPLPSSPPTDTTINGTRPSNPDPSPSAPSAPLTLAPEVSAGQPTFGARLPASALARTLIALTGRPLAAPSANASTRPSPTCARHVADDLSGRGVGLVLDGGACRVGVESTVVDGLSDPPAVLRPGGVGIDEIRACPGWGRVQRAYADRVAMAGGGEGDGAPGPRAPGMKYKHYSPRARVVLFEVGAHKIGQGEVARVVRADDEGLEGREEKKKQKTVAVIRTGGWPVAGGLRHSGVEEIARRAAANGQEEEEEELGFAVREGSLLGADGAEAVARLLDVDLGGDVKGVAHGLFAALRELDRLGADVIFVEGVGDRDDIAAAVMNRLRKAASEIRT